MDAGTRGAGLFSHCGPHGEGALGQHRAPASSRRERCLILSRCYAGLVWGSSLARPGPSPVGDQQPCPPPSPQPRLHAAWLPAGYFGDDPCYLICLGYQLGHQAPGEPEPDPAAFLQGPSSSPPRSCLSFFSSQAVWAGSRMTGPGLADADPEPGELRVSPETRVEPQGPSADSPPLLKLEAQPSHLRLPGSASWCWPCEHTRFPALSPGSLHLCVR